MTPLSPSRTVVESVSPAPAIVPLTEPQAKCWKPRVGSRPRERRRRRIGRRLPSPLSRFPRRMGNPGKLITTSAPFTESRRRCPPQCHSRSRPGNLRVTGGFVPATEINARHSPIPSFSARDTAVIPWVPRNRSSKDTPPRSSVSCCAASRRTVTFVAGVVPSDLTTFTPGYRGLQLDVHRRHQGRGIKCT